MILYGYAMFVYFNNNNKIDLSKEISTLIKRWRFTS